MPAEHKEEQILASVEAMLSDIQAGDTYWYTPAKVTRADQFLTQTFLREQWQIIYGIRDTSESIKLDALGKFEGEVFEFVVTILLCYRKNSATEDPHEVTSSKLNGTIRNRMIQDVRTAALVDKSRGGLAITTFVDAATKDFEEGVTGWILAESALRIWYEELI